MAQPIWNIQKGSIGTFPANIPFTKLITAKPVLPATTVTYVKIAGSLPDGVQFNSDGLLYGTPTTVGLDTTFTFVIRAVDNQNNLSDRTFTITVSGSAIPKILTPSGIFLTVNDSTWVENFIEYSNPLPSNVVSFKIIQGTLPPGLQMNEYGLIRGYAEPVYLNLNLEEASTSVVRCEENIFTALTTANFVENRPIVFSGSIIGGVVAGRIYYVKNILNNTQFTVSTTVDGNQLELSDETGYMDTTLPATGLQRPTIKSFSFTVSLESNLGNDIQTFEIVVVNQNLPISQGGSGLPPNTRVPTIYNIRPPIFDYNLLPSSGFYIVPKDLKGITYTTKDFAFIGDFASGNYFSFEIIGHDFDGNQLQYNFVNLPLGLVGNTQTGWITGTPVLNNIGVNEFNFSVFVSKLQNPQIVSKAFNFSFKLSNSITSNITWLTPNNLGIISNGSTSVFKVEAIADVILKYRLIQGTLPPNLKLLDNGELTGQTAWQPTTQVVEPGTNTLFTFTIEAFSEEFYIIKSSKTFYINVIQEYAYPSESLYIKATPSLENRNLLRTLLLNEEIIPTNYLYRPSDPRFGKATDVIYAHAFGIDSSSFDKYIEAVTKNHYWRNIILGSISTAVAKNNDGEIIYEVVYSNVIDNLVNIKNESVPEEIIWPRKVNLFEGPWYTSITDIYTSYIFQNESESQFLETENNLLLSTENAQLLSTELGQPTYFTSLTPGYARIFYPNSLPNMRNRIAQVLGQQANYKLLPKWMTSQQPNGSTLGYVPAWVICYTKPGFSEIIKNNIENNWKNELGQHNVLNQINFKIDRFIVDKSTTFNYNDRTSPPAWLSLPSGNPEPVPIDSKDFYVLFPRKTILPNTPQYS